MNLSLALWLILSTALAEGVRFFSVDAGWGHLMIERAVIAGVQANPDLSARGVDLDAVKLNSFLSPGQNYLFKDYYDWTAQRAPWLWGFIYYNAPRIQSSEARRETYRGFVTPDLVDKLGRNEPGLIFSTHPIDAEIVDVLKEDGLLPSKTKSVLFVTDYNATKVYLTRGLILVPHEKVRDQLIAMGKDPKLVHSVGGIPASPQFLTPYEKSEVRARLAARFPLGADKPLVLAAGGGGGFYLDDVVDFLPKWRPARPVKLVVVAAKHPTLKIRLDALVEGGSLHPYVDVVSLASVENSEMADLMKSADFMISKPGGSSSAEAFALRLPIFSHRFIPGQEGENIKLFEKIGVGEHFDLKDLNDIDSVLERARRLRERMAIEFPDPTGIPKRVAELVERYYRGEIEESAEESLDLEKRIERRKAAGKSGTIRGKTCAERLIEELVRIDWVPRVRPPAKAIVGPTAKQ